MKLINKLLLLYVIVIALPIIVLSFYSFNHMETAAKERLRDSLDYNSDNFVGRVQMNIEHIDRMAAAVNENTALKEYVDLHWQLGIDDILFFYQNHIKNIERAWNSNPAIYQARVFLKNDNFLERWPIVYNEDRLQGADWPWEELGRPSTAALWLINEPEHKIPPGGSELRLVSLVRELRYGREHLGYLEVSMTMENFFGGMYETNENDSFIAVYDNAKEEFYYNAEGLPFDNQTQNEQLFEVFKAHAREDGYFEADLNGNNFFVSCRYISALDLYLFNTVNESGALVDLNEQRNTFIVLAVFLILVLYPLTWNVISILLKRINQIIIFMRGIRDLNQTAELDVKGDDEAGELAEHLRGMLSRINNLMSDVLKKQELAKNAEIKALLNQINAHFMNNTLESIRGMAEFNDQVEISDSLSNLGKLLRYSMNWRDRFVTLREEVNYVRSYIDLLNIRKDYHINVTVQIEEGLEEYMILKMSLQPLVENAVQHGIDPTQSDSVIRITAFRQDDCVLIEVTDPGTGIEEETVDTLNETLRKPQTKADDQNDRLTGGIGLKNIAERISFYFGAGYGVSVVSRIACFTKVILRLPTKEAAERESDNEKHLDS